MNKQKTAK